LVSDICECQRQPFCGQTTTDVVARIKITHQSAHAALLFPPFDEASDHTVALAHQPAHDGPHPTLSVVLVHHGLVLVDDMRNGLEKRGELGEVVYR
jgi:hypothetical protein